MIDIDHIEKYKENNRIEAKKALGGLPKSIWETYSAFANTMGGVILLGVEEHKDKSLHPVDLPDPDALIKEFSALLNDKTKVSENILSEKNIEKAVINGKRIIAIIVPKALICEMPVYLENNVYNAYKRTGEGDYKLSDLEVDNMLKAARDTGKGEANLSEILFIGNYTTIKEHFPCFKLTYNGNNIEVNLLEYYRFVIKSIQAKTNDAEVIDAISEAIVNAIVNADYSSGGVDVIFCKEYIRITNDGTFKMKLKNAQTGGFSEPNNPMLIKLFARINASRRTGSGIPHIYGVWRKKAWANPVFHISKDQVSITLYFSQNRIHSGNIPDFIKKDMIIDFLTLNIHCTVDTIASVLESTYNDTESLLTTLIEENIITENNGIYKLKDR